MVNMVVNAMNFCKLFCFFIEFCYLIKIGPSWGGSQLRCIPRGVRSIHLARIVSLPSQCRIASLLAIGLPIYPSRLYDLVVAYFFAILSRVSSALVLIPLLPLLLIGAMAVLATCSITVFCPSIARKSREVLLCLASSAFFHFGNSLLESNILTINCHSINGATFSSSRAKPSIP